MIEELSDEELTEKIRESLAKVLGKDKSVIQKNTSFRDDLGIESLMALEILSELEYDYNITIPEEELVKLDNLEQTVKVVKKYLTVAS